MITNIVRNWNSIQPMRWCSMHPRSPIFFSFGEEGWGVIELSGFWFSECVCIKFRMCFHDVPQGTLILKMFPTTQHLHIACAMLSTPHWHIPNSTLPNSQFHIAKFSTPCHQIANFTLRALHCQLAKLTSFFWVALIFFTLPSNFL
jgi:hypothetical protein